MQKVLKFFYAFMLIGIVVFYACQKESQSAQDTPQISQAQTEPVITSLASLNAKTSVEDGVLVFDSINDFRRTISFLKHAPKEEVQKWEATLTGFTSVQTYYAMALSESTPDSSKPNIAEEVAAKYAGKVTLTKDGVFLPLIPNGTFYGRIVGVKGMYKIGKLIVMYYQGKVISVSDGDLQKLAIAQQNLVEDTAKGVYMHDLISNPNALSANNLATRGVIITATCSGSCPSSYSNNTYFNATDGGAYQLYCHYDITDNGYAYSNGVAIDYSINISIGQSRLQYSWLTGYRYVPWNNGFTWGIGWGIDLGAGSPSYLLGPGGPQTGTLTAGGQSWAVPSSSGLNYSIELWSIYLNPLYRQAVINQVLSNPRIQCIDRIGLTCTSYGIPSPPSLPNANHNDQYCQK